MPGFESLADRTDLRILDALRRNARSTFEAIGSEIGLSASAVKRRVSRLEDQGVIRGYTVVVDDSQLGNPIEAFTELTFAGDTQVADIAAVGAGIPEVETVYTTAGDPDALVLIRVRDVAHLTTVIDQLRRGGKVTSTKTLMVLSARRPGAAAGH